jgi:hypothetical protein
MLAVTTLAPRPGYDGPYEVALASIRTLDETYPAARDIAGRPFNLRHAQQLLAAGSAALPPLEVCRVPDGTLILVGGEHRLAVYQAEGLDSVPVFIKVLDSADESAVYQEVFQSNQGHGLPLTTAERMRYAVWLYTDSIRRGVVPVATQIAQQCGVSYSGFMAQLRQTFPEKHTATRTPDDDERATAGDTPAPTTKQHEQEQRHNRFLAAEARAGMPHKPLSPSEAYRRLLLQVGYFQEEFPDEATFDGFAQILGRSLQNYAQRYGKKAALDIMDDAIKMQQRAYTYAEEWLYG